MASTLTPSWLLISGNAFSAFALESATLAAYLGLVFHERAWIFNWVSVSVSWLLTAVVLFVTAIFLRRAMSSYHPTGMRMVWKAMSFTAYCTAIYAVLIFPAAFASVWDGNEVLTNILSEGLYIAKAIASSVACTLGGLGMVAFGVVQWRARKLLQVAGAANAIVGLATLFLLIEIPARFNWISNYNLSLQDVTPISWILTSLFLFWGTTNGLLLILGLWKSSSQNRITVP